MQSPMSPESRDAYLQEIATDYERVRRQHANKKGIPLLTLEKARANKMKVDFTGRNAPVKPKFIGRREFKNVDLAALDRYIDWGPFFQTWDLAGAYPGILSDRKSGVQGKSVSVRVEQGGRR